MGSPKRQRKKFSKPIHPWQKERILAEKELLRDYGLNRKYEIWKMNSILKNFTTQAKNLITIKNLQVEKERSQLLTKLSSLGLLGKDAKIEDVLSLTLKDVMERRLQTLVYRKNLANSIRQARQFIVHEHISLGEKTVTAPSYLVPLSEENKIQFVQNSVFSNADHPERMAIVEGKKHKKSKEKKRPKEKAEEKAITEESTDKKVEKMVEQTKKFAEGKEETAADIIKEVEKEAKSKVLTAHDLKKQKEKKTKAKEE